MHSNHSLLKIILWSFLISSCVPKKNSESFQATADSIQTPISAIKLKPVVFGGNRYVVEADFGLNNKVPLMIHGNANLYLMITHETGEKLKHGNPIEKARDYGYSEKGMGKITVEKFQVGDHAILNTPEVLVFDWPEEEGKAAQGMLGIHFLEKEKVRIDFAKEELQIGVLLNEQPDQHLTNQGYSFTKFFIENGEGYMNVYFDALQKEIPITIGTVADDFSFDRVTFEKSIALEKTEEKESSPSHTTPQVYTNAAPVTYSIANQSFEIPAQKIRLYSFAEYENKKQSELFPYGIIGRDWMKENQAIIDYANKILYFKAREK